MERCPCGGRQAAPGNQSAAPILAKLYRTILFIQGQGYVDVKIIRKGGTDTFFSKKQLISDLEIYQSNYTHRDAGVRSLKIVADNS